MIGKETVEFVGDFRTPFLALESTEGIEFGGQVMAGNCHVGL